MTKIAPKQARGFVLVFGILVFLIFLILALVMLTETRSHSKQMSAKKLDQFYNTAAISVINRVRAQVSTEYLPPDPIVNDKPSLARFGQFLSQGGAENSAEGYGFLYEQGNIPMNLGLIELTYKAWVKNNPDDPALLYHDPMSTDPDQPTAQWDFDSRLVVTVEIFGAQDSVTPVSVHTALLGAELIPEGGATLGREIGTEGNAVDSQNSGTGTAGTGSITESFSDFAGATP